MPKCRICGNIEIELGEPSGKVLDSGICERCIKILKRWGIG